MKTLRFRPLSIMLLLLGVAGHADQAMDLSISPSKPVDTKSCTLAPAETADLQIKIAKRGPAHGFMYVLKGAPVFKLDQMSSDFVWVQTGSGDDGQNIWRTYYIVNTAHKSEVASVTATCVWTPAKAVPKPGGGGGGGGGGGKGKPAALPPDINGLAVGTAFARPPGEYWNKADKHLLYINELTTLWAFENDMPQKSNWTTTPPGEFGGECSQVESVAARGTAASEALWDLKVTSVSCATGADDDEYLTVVGVDHLEYWKEKAWVEMPDPLYVGLGQKVYFRAVKQPAAAPWPAGKPVWTGTDEPSGETAARTFTEVSASAGDFKLVKAECGNVVEGKVIVLKVDITFADPDDSNWSDLEEKKVILCDKTTRIKLRALPQLLDLQTIFNALGTALKIKTSGTAPDGRNYTLTAQNITLVQGDGYSEMRVSITRDQLRSIGALPSQESDSISEKAWYDMGDANYDATSNLRDGDAFEAAMSATTRGRCTRVGDLNSTPPNSPLDGSFFKAAGREIITAEYGGAISVKRQIMNQSDYFYYSGHGWHVSGTTAAGGPSDVSGYWNKDLNVVIIAGCSVLDINDYENNFTDPAEHMRSPGKDWEPLGPAYLLGYNYEAPSDLHGSDTIISSWCAKKGSLGIVEAWREANSSAHAWNACAIKANTSYFYFHKVIWPVYVWTEAPKTEW